MLVFLPLVQKHSSAGGGGGTRLSGLVLDAGRDLPQKGHQNRNYASRQHSRAQQLSGEHGQTGPNTVPKTDRGQFD